MKISRWPVVVVGMLGCNVGIVGVTVYCATSDPSFAVEPNYDVKAARWNERAAERARMAELGWTADLAVLPPAAPGEAARRVMLRVADGAGRPIADGTVSVDAFHHAAAGARQRVALAADGAGGYVGVVRIERGGLWRFSTTVTRGAEALEAVFEREVPAREAGTP